MGKEKNIEKTVGKRNQKKRCMLLVGMIGIVILVAIIVIGMMLQSSDYTIETIAQYNYFKLYENGKYGIIDKEGNILLSAQYDMIQIPNPSKAIFVCSEEYNEETGEYKTKVYNEKGEALFIQYEQVKALPFKETTTEVPFEKSVLAYQKDGKYGLLDFDGKEITKAIYDSIESLLYKEGCLLVKQDGKYGIITMKGKELIKPEYDTITADGYYNEETKYQAAGFIIGNKTQEGYRYGYINRRGEKLLETEYNEVDRVTELIDDQNVYLVAFQKGQAAVLKNKEYIVKHEYEDVEYNRSNQLFIVQKVGKQGVMDLNGKMILNTEYDNIFLAGEEIQAQKDGKTLYFSKTGELKEKEKNISYVSVEDGKYYICIEGDNQYGIANQNKESILKNEYQYVEYAFDDYFMVTKDGKIGIIDAKTGENKVPYIYQVVQKIENNKVIQAINTQTNTTVIYNNEIEKTVELKDATIYAQTSYIKILSDTDRIYLDQNGKKVDSKVIFPNNTLLAEKVNARWGFIDREGNQKVEAIYDMVTELNSYGYAGIKKDGKWGVINAQGQVIVEPSYQIEWQEPEFIGRYCKLNFGYGLEYYTDELTESE